MWEPNQENAFQEIKNELSSNRILAWYDPDADTIFKLEIGIFYVASRNH